MREILFRGKRYDNGERVHGDLVHVENKSYISYYYESPLSIFINEQIKYDDISIVGVAPFIEVDLATIGQYTGLTDKNGTKIFEGDCFKTYCTGLPVYKHIVGYYPEHFAFMARCIEMNTVHYLSDYRPSAIEIIGNIYDNPELLEATE